MRILRHSLVAVNGFPKMGGTQTGFMEHPQNMDDNWECPNDLGKLHAWSSADHDWTVWLIGLDI